MAQRHKLDQWEFAGLSQMADRLSWEYSQDRMSSVGFEVCVFVNKAFPGIDHLFRCCRHDGI